MRPRVFPAEDLLVLVEEADGMSGFNEAAGIPRGRLRGRIETIFVAIVASMRPRVFPAEDGISDGSAAGNVSPGFNEAAGIPRGRRRRFTWRVYRPAQLQ